MATLLVLRSSLLLPVQSLQQHPNSSLLEPFLALSFSTTSKPSSVSFTSIKVRSIEFMSHTFVGGLVVGR
uniref:Uncharacterized protein n=1 Tax=Rhizophora mucronata TaxID=61149 RepID=A0A2P2JL70_RHIMU